MRVLALVVMLLGVPAGDADEQYTYVVALAEKGLNDRVVKEARAFLEEHADHPKADLARYRLACALFELGREDEARAPFSELARRADFEFAAEVQFRLAQCCLASARRDEAEACLKRVLAAGKEYLRAPALALLAQSELARQDPASALEHFTALAECGKDEFAFDARCGRAWCFYRLKRPAEARLAATEALRDAAGAPTADATASDPRRAGPKHADPARAVPAPAAAAGSRGARSGEMSFLVGECFLDEHDPKSALQAYRAVADGPYADAARRGVGFALAALGDHRAAADEFAAVLARFPKSPLRAECALQQGVELLAAHEPRAARAAFGLPELANDLEALAWRGRAEAEDGDLDAALATLTRALASKPEHAVEERLVLQRADLLARMGRTKEANDEYLRVGSDRALLAVAVRSIESKRWSEATDASARLLETFPESPLRVEALLALGESLFGAQEYRDAEEAFGAALDLDRDPARRARTQSRAAWCVYLSGDRARAAQAFDELAASDSAVDEVEEAAFMAGRAREDAGDTSGARRAYEAAAKRFPRGAHAADAEVRAALLDESASDSDRLLALTALARKELGGALGARVSFELAERLSTAGRGAEAVPEYQRVLADEAGAEYASRARYGLAWSLYQLGRHDESDRALAPLLDAGAKDASQPVLVGAARELAVWTALKRGDLDLALARWRELLAGTHDDARAAGALRALCAALTDAKRGTDALAAAEAYERSAATEAGRARGGLERVRLHTDAGDPDAAERELERVRSVISTPRTAGEPGAGGDPATADTEAVRRLVADATFRLAEARLAANADAQAIALYDEAARSPDAALATAASYKAAFARLRSGDAEGAERALAAWVEGHPRDDLLPDALFLLGEARYRRSEFDGAIEVLERVRRDAPGHAIQPKALFRLGLAYGRKERWKDCTAALNDLLRANPAFANQAEAELWRGRALAGQDDARAARTAFERVLTLDRGSLSAQAHLGLGRLSEARGDQDGALSEYLKVAVLYAGDDDVAEALVAAGNVLEAQGQREQASAQYREARDKHPRSIHAAEAERRLARLAGG